MCMTAYVEIVILDNFVLTYCLGALSHMLLLKKISKRRCALAAVVGTTIALFYPFVSGNLLLFGIKLALWVVLSLILFLKKDKLVLGGLLFLVLTFLMGGAMFGVTLAITGDVNMALRGNFSRFPLSVLVACTYLCHLAVKKMSIALRARSDVEGTVYEFTLSLMGKRKKLRGFIDTGNRLYDDKSGLPVVVVSAKSIEEMFSDEEIKLLFLGKGELIQKKAHYVNYGALDGKRRKILLLEPDEFILYLGDKGNIFYDVMVGVALTPIRDTVNYDAILHPSLAKGGNNV